ncbi:UNVERIFIED_ORG: hypothetical protein GGD58_005705 [Rhizobium pisi]
MVNASAPFVRPGTPSLQPHGAPSLQPHPEARSPEGEASKDGAGHRNHPPSSFEAPAGHLRMRADRCACRLGIERPAAAAPSSALRAPSPQGEKRESRGRDYPPSPRKRGEGAGRRMRGGHGAPSLQPHPEVRSPQGEASKDGAGHRSHPPPSFEAPAGHLRMRADRCACRLPSSLPSAVAAPSAGAQDED